MLTLADMRAELGRSLPLSATTTPDEVAVERFITRIESEVRSYVQGGGAAWPTDTASDRYQYVRSCCVEGVRWLTLRAKWATARDRSDEVTEAERTYREMVKRIAQIGLPSGAVGAETARSIPTIGDSPALGRVPFDQTFADWTAQRLRGGDTEITRYPTASGELP